MQVEQRACQVRSALLAVGAVLAVTPPLAQATSSSPMVVVVARAVTSPVSPAVAEVVVEAVAPVAPELLLSVLVVFQVPLL